jgi:Sec7-like guanine-nucleotide exchange factor
MIENIKLNRFAKRQTDAIRKFNENQKKGLKLLVESGLVKNSAEDIAKFFLFCEHLKKVYSIF